jgi:hypothetical protein
MNTKFENKEKFSVANMVADRIIAKALENNKLIWDIDWYSPCCNFEGRQYKGFNRLLLDPGIYITWTKLCESDIPLNQEQSNTL